MCNNGIPVLDVFQMTESSPPNDKKAVIKNVDHILTSYFQRHPSKPCVKRTHVTKRKKNETNTTIEGTKKSKTDSSEDFPVLIQKNAANT